MNLKSSLGQFYTKSADYILQGLEVPDKVSLIEPFVGEGDLIKWIGSDHDVESYDIDPKVDAITQNTLLNPPSYEGKFVITNPPYLARNKNKDKYLYDKYKLNDLYKIAILTMIKGNVSGGILIVPLNFICSPRNSLRKLFLEQYKIDRLNIFLEPVFPDTDINICSFRFSQIDFRYIHSIPTHLYPLGKCISLSIDTSNNYTIGGNLFPRIKSDYSIGRLLVGQEPNTNLYLRSYDANLKDKRISLLIKEDAFYGKISDRMFASITTKKRIVDEEYISSKFNEVLEMYRERYHSLFLTNYRDGARKRIFFKNAYSLIEQILNDKLVNNV